MVLSVARRAQLGGNYHGGKRPVLPQNRLSVGPDGHYYYKGNPIILRGVNYGHELFWQPGDAAIFRAMGANTLRIPVRAWSPPTGDGKGDGYDPTSPISGFINIDYFNSISRAAREWKASGTPSDPTFVIFAFDSNCGQAERTDPVTGANCWIGGAPSTFWMPNAAARFQNHKNSIKAYLRTNLGYVDLIEPLVEPHPTVTYPYGQGLVFDNRDVMILQENIMQEVQPEDPGICWLIGGLSYFVNRFGAPSFMARADWIARGNVSFTCNMLDGKVTDTFANVAVNIALMTDFRARYHRAILINQVGSRDSDDPTFFYENQIYGMFASPPNGGGSISYTKWEGVGDTNQSYAPFKQADVGLPRTQDNLRIASMTAGFALPRSYA